MLVTYVLGELLRPELEPLLVPGHGRVLERPQDVLPHPAVSCHRLRAESNSLLPECLGSKKQWLKIQGDTSHCFQPPVDNKTKVAF